MSPENPKRPPISPDEWLSHAESDLKLARLASRDESIHREQVCFHTQQAAEKALKAVLLADGISFPLTHDIEVLLQIAEENGLSIPEVVREAGMLTPYAVETRYPGHWGDITGTDVDVALDIAERMMRWARGEAGSRK